MNTSVEGYEVEELDDDDAGKTCELLVRFVDDLRQDSVELPSLPHVAQRMHEAVQDADVDLQRLGHIVGQDAGIAARILRTANSPLYRGESPCREVADGVSRLGFGRTRELVMAFTMKHMFVVSDPALMFLMEKHWRHSRDVAVTSYVLAERSRDFESERALMMGLMHDIGVVPLIAHAVRLGDEQQSVDELPTVLDNLKAEAGHMLLARWGFEDELLTVVRDVDDIARQPVRPDYCDLVQIAHYCVDFLAGSAGEPPSAFERSSDFDASSCVRELASAKDEIRALRNLVDLDA